MNATLAETKNPVFWQEQTHQTRLLPRWMRRGQIIGLIAITLVVGLTLWQWNDTNGYPAMQTALFTVWMLQAITMVRAIIAGSNAISREYVGLTWDALVLTGVSIRQIFLGKWGAALHTMRWWILALGAMRLAMLPIFSLGIVKTFASYYQYQGSYSYQSYADFTAFKWVPWAWFLAVIMSVALTFLDVLCCTALGLATSALTRRGITALVLAILIRFMPVMIFSAFVRYELGPTFFWRWWGRTEFSLADAGTSAMMVLALPSMPWTRNEHAQALPGLFMATGMLAALLVVSVLATWIVIRRTGALPHHKSSPSSVAQKT